ncbi:MAG: PAS domain S-box protein, partial [Bacteroidales bacterium]|nr:PAS domain S-box protein [Bacteroidales bacterium]
STLINYKGQKSILSIARDISKRKNAEEEVVHERLLLRTLIDNLPDAIYVKDKNARKIIANKADMLLMNCKSENDFLGKTDIEIYHNNEKGIHGYDEDILVISTGKPLLNHENHYIDSNGCDRWRIINKIPLFDEQKQVIGLVGIGKDITERKKAEEALYVSEEKYRTLFNQSFLGIYLHDLNGNIIDINQMACMQSGFSRDELLKMSVFENMPAIDENFDIAKDSIIKEWKQWKIGQRTTLQAEHRRKDGSVYPVEISTGLIRYRDKNILLAIVQDITKRKEAENELIRLKEKAEESDRLKTAFLHNISHEIRTPMNAIVGFSELLKNPELPVNKRNVFSELISNSSKQLLTIINDIVNIATVEAGQEKIHEKQVNINSLFHLLYEQLIISAQKKSLVLNYKTALPDEDSIILTDEIKLSQVISNLVSNAIKYTKMGNIEFGYVLKDAKLEFYVKDTGFGIPQNKQNDIFIRFHQIEPDDKEYYGGSGLGLAISKAYVELLGGNIWLNSQVGAGSVFYFTIPYKKTENINHDVSNRKTELNKTTKKITLLVTEDDNTNFMLLQEVFSSPKFLIIRALNGFESVEICKKNKLIDLVIMDIKMPLMDGYEATSEIKKVCPRLPVIALTAYSTDVDKEKAIKSGCCDFVSKPFKHNELIAKIEKYI